jgi:di/tricarboxylate transporter
MTPALITVFILVIAIILLSATRLRPDVIALMVLLALGLSGVVDEGRIFSGFSSTAVMTILGISMISVALTQTGVANSLGKIIFRIGGKNEIFLILLVALSSALLSLFMNNIAAVGILLPAIMSLTRKSKTPPSRLLMPLAFGTILGGMATLLTTSNIIVSGALKDAGLPSFGLLDFFPVGAPVVVIGVLYLITLGRKLLPNKTTIQTDYQSQELSIRLREIYQLNKNILRINLFAGSPFANKTIKNSEFYAKTRLNILGIIHKKKLFVSPDSDTLLLAGDVLIAQGKIEEETATNFNLEILSPTESQSTLADESKPLAEVVLSPHSRLIGKSLCELHFRAKYGLNVISLWRSGKPVHEDFSDLKLEFGDALLVQGSASLIRQIHLDPDLFLLEEDPDAVFLPGKAGIALAITFLTLGVAAIGKVPVALTVLSGAILLMLTGCMTINDAFQRIEWKAIFLIAGMWPLSIAIRETGLAAGLIDSLLRILGPVDPLVMAGLLLFIAMIFTQFMSGPVTPLAIIPIALAAAQKMGLDPRPFALAVALGCSLAFITPLGHPVNIMVMNPGGYSFKDYFRVGFPLTILAFFTILAGLHFIWGL